MASYDEKQARILQLQQMYNSASKEKSVYVGMKNDWLKLNNSLARFSENIQSAMDHIFGAKTNCENGGFISDNDEILGGSLIGDIYTNLEYSYNAMVDLHNWCIKKMNEFQSKIDYCDTSIAAILAELNSLGGY